MAHVGVVFGGRSVEHQVSIRSARTVAQGLREAGHSVTPLGIASDGCWIDADASAAVIDSGAKEIPPLEVPVAPTVRHLLASGVEVVFPILHGTWGEDGTFQGLCEMLDLAYVGCGVTASALAMDKVLAKRQLAAAGVPVVDFEVASRRDFEAGPAAFLGPQTDSASRIEISAETSASPIHSAEASQMFSIISYAPLPPRPRGVL